MLLGGLARRSCLLALDGGEQHVPEERQRPEALEPPEAGLDVEQGGREPALVLVRRAPVIDLGGALLHERVQRLQAVGRLQAAPELGEDAEAMEGQGLLQPLEEARGGRLVQHGG